jgi:hypothetical protein
MKITQGFIESLPALKIFAAGLVWDTTVINITGKRILLRWVAARGGVADWAVYVGMPEESFGEIARVGDKVSKQSAFALLDCDEAAQQTYRS